MASHPGLDDNGAPVGASAGENVLQLREALDEALRSASTAIHDTSRLTRLFVTLSEPAPLELMLDRALSTLSELFVADIVVLLDPAGTGTYSPLAAVGLPEEMLHPPMSWGDEGNALRVMATRVPLLKSEMGSDAAAEPQLRELGAEVAVWVPVTDSHSARGVLILARCRPAPFLDADVDLLTAMAYRIGLALEQAQHSAQLVQIVQTGREIGRHLDEPRVWSEAVRMLPAVLWVDAAALVFTDQGGAPRCVALVGLDLAWNSTWERLTEHLIMSSSPATALPYSTPDLGRTDGWLSLDSPGNCPVRALVAVPVQREAKLQGLLYAMRFSPSAFTPDTIQMTLLYADQISAAMENARLYRLMRDELAERMRAEQELRESEERFKLALLGGDLGMWDWNVASGEVHLDERSARMLGYSREDIEPCVRRTWKELVHRDDLAHALEALKDHLEGRTHYFETKLRMISRSGGWIWVLNKGKVTHRDGEGRPLRVVGTHMDISEAKRIEAERLLIEQQKQQLWKAESLNRMAGGIAHNFNNQLMVVMGNLELVLNDLPQESKTRALLTDALNASARAAEISHLMVAYLGQKRVKKGHLDLAKAVEEARPLLAAPLPKNVCLTVHPRCKGPVIQADGVHFKQILTNLVVNAAEAIGEEKGEITLEIGRMTKDEVRASRFFPADWVPGAEDYAFVAVSDTGCGLDEGGLENIFDPFFSTKFPGRGLGLPVALGLVRAHDGAIAVESRLGRGTTFRLLFPLPSREFPPLRNEEASALEVARDSGLVLVVDDEPMIRRLAATQLRELGYETLEACDGIEAVEMFRARRDDLGLVILDLSMPRMDGWETLAALRALRPDIPVVLASGYNEVQVMSGEHTEWPQAFLHKPYKLKDLVAALGKARKSPPRS